MANRRFIDFPIATTVGDNDIVLIWQDGANKQTTKATFLSGLPENLEDLNDVVISGLTNGQILRYDSVTGKWENTDQGNLDLNDLNDVSIVSPSNGQVLVYNSSTSKWENSSGGFVPYVGAVTTVDLGAQGLRAGYVRFDTSVVAVPDEQGLMYWDASRSTAALIMNGTLQHIGQDSFFYVKNSSGSTIPKGTCVGFAGTDGASGHLLVTPFLANGSVPSTYFMGVTSEEIVNGAFGQVMHFGELEGINTSGFTAGALLYASSTVAGAFQTTPPVAPNNIILVAAAVNSKNNGAIVVRPTLGSNFNTNESVKLTSVANLDLLQYQSGTGVWENKTLAQVIGSAYVPSTRTLTINGVTQDLSANRTFNVGTVTSVGLSSATSGVTIGSTPVTSSGTITLAIATASGSQQGLLSAADWTTFNNKQNALTNPVTGTGTTNRLAKFTGASTIGNSNISDGGITILNENPVAGQFAWQFNGNTTTGLSFGASVVAGTNSSDIAFRVLNAAASSNYFVVRGDGAATFSSSVTAGSFIRSGGTSSQYLMADGSVSTLTNPVTGTGTTNFLPKFTGSTTIGNSQIFDTGSEVRIFTTSTDARNFTLGVYGVTWDNTLFEVANAVSVFNKTDADNGDIIGFRTVGLQRGDIRASSTSFTISSRTNLIFGSNNTDAMFLFSTGNLLVGTGSDNGARLQVSGRLFVLNQVIANNTITDPTNDNTLTNGTVYALNGVSTVNNFGIGLSGVRNGNYDIWFQTGSINGGGYRFYKGTSELVTIATSGNVGIGITNPIYKFEISDGTRTGVFNPNSILDGFFIGTYQSKPLILGTADTERMRITSGGNVLIGTTTDNGARLQVSGNTYSEGLHIATGQFVQGASATNTFYTFSNTSINRVFLITLRQSGSSANNVVAIGFTFGGALGAYNVIQDNTNPVLFLTISASGLGLRLTTGSGYGTTTWDWTITQLK